MMTLEQIDLTTPWKERDKIDKAEVVRALIEKQGMTGSQAAEILGTTRNAVIGVAERALVRASESPERAAMINARRQAGQMKTFNGRRAQGLPASPRKPKPVPQPKAKRQRKNPPRPTATPKLNQLAPVPDKAWITLDGSTPKPLHEHHHGECLWAIGDSHPALFCCLPIDPGSAYCPTHRALGFRARPSKGTAA